MQSHHIKFGSTITLNCSSEDDVGVQWYLNDKQINKDNPSSVLVLSFRQSGYYQCKVNGNLLDQERSVLLCGVGGLLYNYTTCNSYFRGHNYFLS